MNSTWKQTSTVGEGGRVEVVVPELRAGESVSVVVERNESVFAHADKSPPGKRKLGLLKGKIWMSDDFDEPLDDFAEYM
jgi:uncharacterized protein DUF2281